MAPVVPLNVYSESMVLGNAGIPWRGTVCSCWDPGAVGAERCRRKKRALWPDVGVTYVDLDLFEMLQASKNDGV